MFAIIYKIEPYTITFLIRGYCSIKFQKVYLNGVISPLELGLRMRYEVEDSKDSKLPKLLEIEAYEFENCGDCGRSHEIYDAQFVSINTIKIRYIHLIKSK